MDSTRARTFVLGATFLLGCPTSEPPGQDDGTSSSTGTPSADTSTSGTTSGGTGSTTEGGSTTTSSSSGDDGTTDASSTTAADSSDGGSESSGSTTGEPASACQQGCAVEFTCTTDWPSEQECVTACEANLVKAATFSPFCAAAWENVSECVGTLTCEEYLQWSMPAAFPYPCSDADVGLEVECKGQ